MSRTKRIKNSLMSRTAVSAIAVSLAVLFIVSMILFYWFRMQMVQNYHELLRINVENIDTSFSSKVLNAKNLASSTFMSVDGISLRTDSDTQFLDHMSFINSMQNTLAINTEIDSVEIVSSDREVALRVGILSTSTEHSEEELLSELEKNNAMNSSFFWEMDSAAGDPIPTLTVTIADKSFQDPEFRGLVAVNINLNQLNKQIFSEYQAENYRVVVTDDHQVCLLDSFGTAIGTTPGYEFLNSSANGEMITDKDHDREYLYMQSSFPEFFFTAESTYAQSTQRTGNLLTMMLILLGISCGAVTVTLLFISRKLFGPFNQLVLRIRDTSGETPAPGAARRREAGDEVQMLSNYYNNIRAYSEYLGRERTKERVILNLLSGTGGQISDGILKENGYVLENVPFLLVVCAADIYGRIEKLSEADQLRHSVSAGIQRELEKWWKTTDFQISLRGFLFIVTSKSPEEAPIRKENLENVLTDVAKGLSEQNETEVLYQVSDELSDEREFYPQYRRSSNLLQEQIRRRKEENDKESTPDSGKSTLMEHAVNTIRTRYADSNLNVAMLADEAGISAAYFGQLFYEFTGTRATEFITKTRMEKAYEILLAEPETPVAQVAVKVGYSNSPYFSTQFRKFYGYTPSHFREYNTTVTHIVKDRKEQETP